MSTQRYASSLDGGRSDGLSITSHELTDSLEVLNGIEFWLLRLSTPHIEPTTAPIVCIGVVMLFLMFWWRNNNFDLGRRKSLCPSSVSIDKNILLLNTLQGIHHSFWWSCVDEFLFHIGWWVLFPHGLLIHLQVLMLFELHFQMIFEAFTWK